MTGNATARFLPPLLGIVMTAGLAHAAPPGITGDWRGTLALTQGKSLPVVIHMTLSGETLTATLDSPTQGGFGLPVQTVSLEGNSLTMSLPRLSARYVATLRDGGRILDGTWFQGPSALPLVLTHEAEAAAPSRPQIPHPPFPYRLEDVAFDNPSGPAHLAGTLTLPKGKGPFPAVLLITGSGLQDRDETIMGHKPFLLWADTLTRQGIAVLRVDDRETGGSTGPVASATTRDFAGDTQAGLRFLRAHKEIDPGHIGLMGHSEGGMIAAMIAARDPALAFAVLLGTPSVPGRELMLAQRERALANAQVPQERAQQAQQGFIAVMDAMTIEQTQSEAEKAANAAWNRVEDTTTGLPPELHRLTLPAIRFFDRFDPASDLKAIHCPVLAVLGSKDRQVPPSLTLPAMRQALAGKPRAQIVELPGLNHLLQKAGTGDIAEYATIEEDINPSALTLVTQWIRAQTRP